MSQARNLALLTIEEQSEHYTVICRSVKVFLLHKMYVL